jgi:eukaryotic-like serine/threonine-protein kinase
VLTDFGNACSMLDEASDRSQMLAGSPPCTAPERLGGGEPEPASDMFSLSAPLFTALESISPFRGSSLFEITVAVVENETGAVPARRSAKTSHRRTARQELSRPTRLACC